MSVNLDPDFNPFFSEEFTKLATSIIDSYGAEVAELCEQDGERNVSKLDLINFHTVLVEKIQVAWKARYKLRLEPILNSDVAGVVVNFLVGPEPEDLAEVWSGVILSKISKKRNAARDAVGVSHAKSAAQDWQAKIHKWMTQKTLERAGQGGKSVKVDWHEIQGEVPFPVAPQWYGCDAMEHVGGFGLTEKFREYFEGNYSSIRAGYKVQTDEGRYIDYDVPLEPVNFTLSW